MTTEWWKSINPKASVQVIDKNVTLLEVWDILITENWYEEIKSLIGMCAPADTQLYNFKVSGDHTYYANGYLVHNKQACPKIFVNL